MCSGARARCARSRRSPVCPGNVRIEEEIDGRVERGEDFALLYADLDHFKAFNDHYGFMRGDQAIQTTARDDRGGRARGHRRRRVHRPRRRRRLRVVVPTEKATDAAEAIVQAVRQEVPALYDAEDRERGFIEVANRRGELQRFPLLSISIGVASTEPARVRALRRGRRDRHRDEDLHEGDRRVFVGDRPPHDLIRYSGAGSAEVEALAERHAERDQRLQLLAVSMPSATIAMPISSANETSADVSARLARSPSMSRVRLMSSFTMSGREQQRVAQAREPRAGVVDRDPHARARSASSALGQRPRSPRRPRAR